MAPIAPFIVFPAALAALIVCAHYFLESVRKIGISLNIRPFIMGAFIVAFGTSFPEAMISLVSVTKGVIDVPVAQVVGSNIANILLVLGVAALFARRFDIGKSLIDVELPLIAAVTFIFILISFDGAVQLYEGLILLVGFIVYAVYVFRSEDNRMYPTTPKEQIKGLFRIPKDIAIFLGTAAVIAAASHFVVSSTQTIASIFSVPESIVAITALALGTSLPEMVVSIQAALRNEIELVVGNVVGSNIFNILFVIGSSALVSHLTIGAETLLMGIPVLIGATILFIISGISNRIHMWEGAFYVLSYVVFIGIILS